MASNHPGSGATHIQAQVPCVACLWRIAAVAPTRNCVIPDSGSSCGLCIQDTTRCQAIPEAYAEYAKKIQQLKEDLVCAQSPEEEEDITHVLRLGSIELYNAITHGTPASGLPDLEGQMERLIQART